MKNTIAERIFDFLKNFPPFNSLDADGLIKICGQVEVCYFEEGVFIFKKDDELHDSFYVVKDGAIGLSREGEEVLVDKCDEGDIFGLRALIRKSNYLLDAKTLEESIVYSISSRLLEELITSNNEANKFLLASFAANMVNSYSDPDSGRLFSLEGEFQQNQENLTHIQSVHFKKEPVTCVAETRIEEAALSMTEKRVGSIIITKNRKPIGIITDKDLRIKIATGRFLISDTVKQIMSSPVITIPEKTSIAEAQITMLRNRITHLCITEDGTPQSKLVGVLSEHDIVVTHSNNPSFLVKEVKRAKTAEVLREVRQKSQRLMQRYLNQNIPVVFVSKIISAINEVICQKAIELSLEEMTRPAPTNFTWMALGSQGRREQLLLTDQDNALVFENVTEENYEPTKSFFLELAHLITLKLNVIGFEYCPAEMMASNPKWCLSISEWRDQFNDWITRPDEDKIMLSTIFFDYERIFGDQNLVEEMSQSIFESIDKYEIFLNFLALNTIKNPPPLGFFRQFLVEHSGEHKDMFDIKARALIQYHS